MNKQDVRWEQRFNHFKKALLQLSKAVELCQERVLTELEKQGVIQAFEFTHELAWNVMRDFFYYQGNTEIRGSRDAIRKAFEEDLILDGENWMKMIANRNLTSHTYNEEVSEEIYQNIVTAFYPLFESFKAKMQQLTEKE